MRDCNSAALIGGVEVVYCNNRLEPQFFQNYWLHKSTSNPLITFISAANHRTEYSNNSIRPTCCFYYL